MALSTGSKLGPYEVLARIGAGGMGEVYKARDTRLNRIVAIKISQERFTERFEREARAVAALDHPNICRLYDIAEADGVAFLVMEFVDGTPLKGPLALEDALKYSAQIAEAMDAAHRKGITHRDLKPGNILVTKAGVKLLDFGLARIEDENATVTMGQVMGTPAYMSPEQWEGKAGDARSDIYAFGCVLYELVTGKRAAADRGAVEPAALESVVRTCLEKDPEDRWQSARDVNRALSMVTVGQGHALPRPAMGRSYSGWIVAAAAAVVIIAAAAALMLWRGRAAAAGEVVSFLVYPPEKTVFSADFNTTLNIPQFAISPDGRTLAFIANAPGVPPMVWLRPIGEVTARPLAGSENALYPSWSPDSRWVGFVASGKVKKIPAAGGAAQVVAEMRSDFRGGSWGPDGTMLFASGTEPVNRVSAAGGTFTPVTAPGTSVESPRWPSFLPDGRHFLYTLVTSAANESGIYSASLDGRTKKLLLHTITSAVYAPPGYLLFVDGDTLMAQAFDADRLDVSGQSFLVAEQVGRASGFQSAVSASLAGTIAYANTLPSGGRLVWFDRSGNSLGSAAPENDYPDFRLSPNEKSLAASVVDPKTATVDIWMTDLQRNSRSRFASGGQLTASGIWSPDGAKLLYRDNFRRGGVVQFFEKSAGGGGNEDLVLTAEKEQAAEMRSTNLIPTDWSPDGRNVMFSAPATGTGTDLWLLPLAGDKKPFQYLATPADEMHGNFSPDGRSVAYTSNESGKFEVYVETLPRSDKKWQVSTEGGYEPRWRADGREVYYLSEDRKLMAVPVGTGPAFGVPKALFQTKVPAGVTANRRHYVPSRDGSRFLINTQSGDPAATPITVVINWTAGLKK